LLLEKKELRMRKIFISPYKGVWSIRYEGETDNVSLCDSPEEAIEEARAFSEKEDNEIIMLRSDGSVESIINNKNEFPG
jgi:hypothetical protein